MSSRDQMLIAIRGNQPDPVVLPAKFRFEVPFTDMVQQFTNVLTSIGGQVVRVATYADIAAHLRLAYDQAQGGWATTLPALFPVCDVDLGAVTNPHDLAGLNLAIIGGQLGVAENGAVWVDERHLPHRVLPMITQYLAIVIQQADIIATMHDAYLRLDIAQTGFGTFIAGPSKTADIEQSLVIGAHGARSLTVYLATD
jgi:L-lactate dehydrogenase complex protein LldG